MGLSRKLGGPSPRGPEAETNAVPYKWSTQTYTMVELLAKFKLPCVVQCATDSCSVVWSDFQFDLRQPLLLYEKRTVQKVHAMSLSSPKAKLGSDVTEPLEEVGPPMAIPCDYEGWFGAAPKGQAKAKRHTRVEGVANSTARRFLVTTKLPAFTTSRSGVGGASSGHIPHEVTPGEVLKRVCVLDPSPADPDCPAVVREHGPCLECLDEKDEDVVIPLSRLALLYEIAEAYPDQAERVFTMAQVVAAGNSKLPRVLKLAHGEPPLLAYAFTGMVRCYSVFTEETVLAATLDDMSSICLELATDSSARFRLGLNEAAVRRTCEYGNALGMCDTFGSKFLTGIKVSFSLQPELCDLEDIDLSFYESQNSFSDTQEVEANSEFEISWGAVKKAKLLTSAAEVKDKDGAGANGVESTDDDDDYMFLEGFQGRGGDEDEEGSNEDSDTYAVVAKVKNAVKRAEPDTNIPQHRDFTEHEIADLMQRKGMLANSDKSGEDSNDISFQELDALKENKVRDNPLYYLFQKQSGKVDSLHGSETQISEIQEKETAVESKKSSSISTGEEDKNQKLLTENLPDLITDPTDNTKLNEDSADTDEGELDSSAYEQVVCTPAREYSEAEVGESGSDSDNDNDVLYGNEDSETTERPGSSGGTKTHFPIEANVVVKAMGKRATRSYQNISMAEDTRTGFRRPNIDTSSSDDVNSDFERKDLKILSVEQSPVPYLAGESHRSSSGADGGFLHPKNTGVKLERKNIKRSVSSSNSVSSSKETSFSDVFRDNGNSNTSYSSPGPQDSDSAPLVASPPRPTFTEVDDPLESTMSELDKVTSIKPSSFSGDSHSRQGSQSSLSRTHASQAAAKSPNTKHKHAGSKPSSLRKPDDSSTSQNQKVSASPKNSTSKRPQPLHTAPSPKTIQVSSKKHADVMQEENRYDSPKVSHHPHVHPHAPAHIHGGVGGSLHAGRWTKPVPLGGVAADRNDAGNENVSPNVLDSIKTFERLGCNTTTSTTNGTTTSSSDSIGPGHVPTHPSKDSDSSSKHNSEGDVRAGHTLQSNSNANITATEPFGGKTNPMKNFIKSLIKRSECQDHKVLSLENSLGSDSGNMKSFLSHSDLDAEADSEEETTVEETFLVSTDVSQPSRANLRVLPVYHEDIDMENFV